MHNEPEVFSITGADTALSQDQSGRQRRYLISMVLRTACFVGGILAEGWLRWVLIFGAVALPYFAVVIANAGRERGAWFGNGDFVPLETDAIGPAPTTHH